MSALPCPLCKAGAARQGLLFEGGWLHDSADYNGLLRCSLCGRHFHRALTCTAPLRVVPASELPEHRTVRPLFPESASQPPRWNCTAVAALTANEDY